MLVFVRHYSYVQPRRVRATVTARCSLLAQHGDSGDDLKFTQTTPSEIVLFLYELDCRDKVLVNLVRLTVELHC